MRQMLDVSIGWSVETDGETDGETDFTCFHWLGHLNGLICFEEQITPKSGDSKPPPFQMSICVFFFFEEVGGMKPSSGQRKNDAFRMEF